MEYDFQKIMDAIKPLRPLTDTEQRERREAGAAKMRDETWNDIKEFFSDADGAIIYDMLAGGKIRHVTTDWAE